MDDFQYSPLDSGQFRLFRLQKARSIKETITLELKAEPLGTGPRPSYETISYTWGDSGQTTVILVNSKRMTISRNLHDVLMFLRMFSPELNLLWADALCINQNDPQEKANQVAVMGPIYRFADRVHVFPGYQFNSVNLTVEALIDLYGRIEENKPIGMVVTNEYLRARNIPTLDDEIWVYLKESFQLPWFHRLWIVQEVVLAQNLIVHVGSKFMEWTFLVDIVQRLRDAGLIHTISCDLSLSCQQPLGQQSWQSILMMDILRRAIYSSRTMGSPFVQVLTPSMMMAALSDRLCKEPVDRVFAWYWLLSEQNRLDLEPDFRLFMKQDHQRMFLKFNHLAIGADAHLLFSLSLTSTRQRLVGLPTWCHNLLSSLDCQPFMMVGDCNAGKEPVSDIGPCVACSSDGRLLYLEGYEVSSVTAVHELQFTHCLTSEHTQCASRNMRWLSGCKEFSSSKGITTIELMSTLTTTSPQKGERSAEDAVLELLYRELTDCWSVYSKSISPNHFPLNQNAFSRMILSVSIISRSNVNRRLFLTSDGTLGSAYQTVQVGDIICVCEGVQVALLFRKEGNIYTLVSDAWVFGLMNGEALERHLPRETFILG